MAPQEKIEAQVACPTSRRTASPSSAWPERSARGRPRARVAKTVYRRELAMTALIVVLVLVVLLALWGVTSYNG